MDERELRIGNWIKRPQQPEGFLVDANTISRIFYSGYNGEEPILLTEEWLIRLGFVNKEIFQGCDYYRVSLFPGSTFMWVLQRVWKGKNYGGEPEIRFTFLSDNIQYVHQLQNLYHALTGEELIYNDGLSV